MSRAGFRGLPDGGALSLTGFAPHYDYCNDVIDQGSVSNLAVAPMARNWWYFCWD
jgi:hypothetical protein